MQELFAKNLSGMNCPTCLHFIFDTHDSSPRLILFYNSRSVVVCDLHIISVAVLPHEAHSELIVDSDAVLAFTIIFQFLQSVAWGTFKSFNCVAAFTICNFRLATFRKFEGGIPWLLPVSQNSFVSAPCFPPKVLITTKA